MQIRLLQLAVLLICLSGCIDRHTNTPAFYVWKSKLSAEDADTAYLNTLGVQKIYARMFDVDNKGNGAFPTADYSPSSGNPDFQQEVVPVIFITNQTILQCPAADIEKLARNCADRIDTVYRSHFNKLPNEYQFDCDWTVKTKENYFNFLKHIRKLRKGALVSCTIRLHQIKFKDKTGVPPVDKGTLMYYASSEPTDFENKNTILNNKDAASYIKDVGSYPLHLDIAGRSMGEQRLRTQSRRGQPGNLARSGPTPTKETTKREQGNHLLPSGQRDSQTIFHTTIN